MVEAVLRRGRGAGSRVAAAAAEYAALGWPVCPGAYPREDSSRHLRRSRAQRGRGPAEGRACSCDRIGCPAPGAHPLSPAWQIEASSDVPQVARWWRERPGANIILVTGRVFDVLDMPATAGLAALAQLDRAGAATGPVAVTADGRVLFFVTTRGAPTVEDEWWSCHLDSEPDSFDPVTGLRWHCRDSYVVGPCLSGPAPRAMRGAAAHWLRGPRQHPLPDSLRLLGFLADACEEAAR
jgi:Bifunctional DNA primase/polymerase, N-terminal